MIPTEEGYAAYPSQYLSFGKKCTSLTPAAYFDVRRFPPLAVVDYICFSL